MLDETGGGGAGWWHGTLLKGGAEDDDGAGGDVSVGAMEDGGGSMIYMLDGTCCLSLCLSASLSLFACRLSHTVSLCHFLYLCADTWIHPPARVYDNLHVDDSYQASRNQRPYAEEVPVFTAEAEAGDEGEGDV